MSDVEPNRGNPSAPHPAPPGDGPPGWSPPGGGARAGDPLPPGQGAPPEDRSPWVDPGGAPPPPPESAPPTWPQAWPDAPPTSYPTSDWGLPPIAPTPLPDKGGRLPVLPPPPPQVRWGIGDVFIGILIWIGSSIVATLILVVTGMIDVNTESGEVGEVGELGLAALSLSLAAGWLGLVGWPVVVTYWKGLRSLAKDFGFTINLGDVGWGVLAGIAALTVSFIGNVLWLVLSDAEQPSNAGFLPTDNPGIGTAIVIFLLVAVCTPVAEELFFRGLFLRAVAKKWNTIAGLLVSSGVFGAFHLTAFSLQGLFICFVTALYGLVLALVVVYRNFRIGPAIVGHMVINGVAVIAALTTGS